MFDGTKKLKIIGKIKYKKNAEIKFHKTENNQIIKYSKESPYLLQYKKYFQKQMGIKYNILPKEYISIQLENFIRAKYCHSLAKFKDDLLFNYQQEFLTKYYKTNESYNKIPLFFEFYKTYLKFFCSPTLSEINLNELIEEMVEKKAKAFYQDNYQEEKEEKLKENKKTINTIFFTNKVRKEISRRNTLTDLSKTTIDFKTTTNKNSIKSYISINLLINEIGNGNKNTIQNINNNDINKNNIGENNKIIKINKIQKNNKHNIKEINKNIYNKINFNKKNEIFKNSSSMTPKEKKFINNINSKNINEIKNKSINNVNNLNIFSNKKLINNNIDFNQSKNKDFKENISKPFYQKINIVNNKIIIINNAKSKVNILKSSNDKLKKEKYKVSKTRNYKNNFTSNYSNNTIGIIDKKSKSNNNSNFNTHTFLLKSNKENNCHKKGLSSKIFDSMNTKSEKKLKHIRIIKEKNFKMKPTINTYNIKKNSINLLENYLYNYKKRSNNKYNTEEVKKKKLTNFQRFSNNIKYINHTQRNMNISKEKVSSFHKNVHSNYSIGSNNKNKNDKILKICTYKTLENLPKLKFISKKGFKKQFSTQEQNKTKPKLNNNLFNKNILSLKLNKK